jgi:hypothetical protein
MQDLNDKLTVLHTEDGVSFEDLSMSAFSFLRGNFSASDTLYVGFRKPINALFFAIQTGSGADAELNAQYWNGSWTSLDLHDETEALAASGFVRWLSPSDQTASAVNGKTLLWVKFSLLVDAPVVISGVGPLLCCEDDLRGVDFSLEEESENILKAMVSARNLICKEMQVSPWDILNLPDVTDAATFLSLSYIYANQSDREDDHYHALSQAYMQRYASLKPKLGILVDVNGNGASDEGEKVRPGVVYFER